MNSSSSPTLFPLGSAATAIGTADSKPAIALNPAADAGTDAAYRAKATDAAIKFEGFFIANMLHQMRSGTRELAGQDSVFKDKANGDMLDMADTLVADKMAGQRAFGIADSILRQLLPPSSPLPSVGKQEIVSNSTNSSADGAVVPRATE